MQTDGRAQTKRAAYVGGLSQRLAHSRVLFLLHHRCQAHGAIEGHRRAGRRVHDAFHGGGHPAHVRGEHTRLALLTQPVCLAAQLVQRRWGRNRPTPRAHRSMVSEANAFTSLQLGGDGERGEEVVGLDICTTCTALMGPAGSIEHHRGRVRNAPAVC